MSSSDQGDRRDDDSNKPGYGASMTDTNANPTPPDRISVDPRSPFYDADALSRGVGIIFNGTERFNVEEYCVSEGWVRLAMAKTRDRKGNPLTMKMNGVVEPFYRDGPSEAEQPDSEQA
jgi:hypothetical protein